MEKKENNSYSVCFSDDIQLFYDVMLGGRKIKNEHEKKEIEASIYAMHLLIPDSSIYGFIGYYGLEECLKPKSLGILSRLFMVDERLMRIRLKLISDKLDKLTDIYDIVESKKVPDYEESDSSKIRQKSKL